MEQDSRPSHKTLKDPFLTQSKVPFPLFTLLVVHPTETNQVVPGLSSLPGHTQYCLKERQGLVNEFNN